MELVGPIITARRLARERYEDAMRRMDTQAAAAAQREIMRLWKEGERLWKEGEWFINTQAPRTVRFSGDGARKTVVKVVQAQPTPEPAPRRRINVAALAEA